MTFHVWQVHYDEILKVGEGSNAYDHYNFFRQRLQGTVRDARAEGGGHQTQPMGGGHQTQGGGTKPSP